MHTLGTLFLVDDERFQEKIGQIVQSGGSGLRKSAVEEKNLAFP